jgi:hypothetical protein
MLLRCAAHFFICAVCGRGDQCQRSGVRAGTDLPRIAANVVRFKGRQPWKSHFESGEMSRQFMPLTDEGDLSVTTPPLPILRERARPRASTNG